MTRYQIDSIDPYQQRITLAAQIAFLTARLDEDGTAALGRDDDAPIHTVGCFYYNHSLTPHVWTAEHCDCEPEVKARVLADIAAKRAIVDLAKTAAERTVRVDKVQRAMMIAAFVEVLTTVIATMVQPYANHPGFDPTWRTV